MMITKNHVPDKDDDDVEGYVKIDRYNPELIDNLSIHYREVLKHIGEEPNREGLIKTPERVAKALLYLTQGYDLDAKEIMSSAVFTEEYSQMVIVKDIEVYSMCEHHMLPFFGKAHVAYIPNGHIVGLSKIPRVVDVYARRLQVQERLTNQIRDCIQETLMPLGVGVVIECRHLCMSMRGVQKQNSVTTTSAFTGAFLQEKDKGRIFEPDLFEVGVVHWFTGLLVHWFIGEKFAKQIKIV